jgi:hypothetical protein
MYKLKANWRLWLCVSLPWIGYLLFKTHRDKADQVFTNWSVMLDYLTNKDLRFFYAWEIIVPCICVPLAIGWIGQYLFGIFWRTFVKERERNILHLFSLTPGFIRGKKARKERKTVSTVFVGRETIETVSYEGPHQGTVLKRGVNERGFEAFPPFE